MKFKTITGGTEAEALAKFPWLADATFEKAVIDITQDYLVWKNGIWEDGTWEGGTWKDGIWKNGTWERGQMWSNIHQEYKRVAYKGGKFTVEGAEPAVEEITVAEAEKRLGVKIIT